jgi:hypothetical protein
MSVAGTVVVAMQDVLRLGNEARMNTPGVAAGNWAWRVGPAGVFTTLVRHAAAAVRARLRSLRASLRQKRQRSSEAWPKFTDAFRRRQCERVIHFGTIMAHKVAVFW